MKTIAYCHPHRALAAALTALVFMGMLGTAARADMYRAGGINSGGGVEPQSVLGSPVITSSNATLSWYGMQGWYTIEATTNVLGGPWIPVVSVPATDFAWSKTVSNPDPTNNWFFRLNQANSYAGSGNCAGCHGVVANKWSLTGHASALATLQGIFQGNNASCLPCHTVGYGKPTGYTNQTLTPHLANVGCENCHGPAGWHKNSDHSLIRPAVSIDPQICGSCHQDSHHPTYEEYSTTPHATVLDDIKYGLAGGVYYSNTITLGGTNLYGYYVTTNANLTLKTNVTTGIIHSLYGPQTLPNLKSITIYDPGQDRAISCGICHSAATRLALLNDYEARQAGRTNYVEMASAKDAGEWTATCATCHDPHSADNPAQLRNPMWSTNYYTMPTTSDKRTVYTTNFNGTITTNVYWMSAAFASLYDPKINVCGQCHNSRGARWDGRGYGLITNTTVVGPVTNLVYRDVFTTNTVTQVFTNELGVPYLTNTYTYAYVSGRIATNVVVASVTNRSIITGVTPAVSYSRPPHHSPQYNLLSGIVQPDYLHTNALGLATNIFGAHSLQPNGCAACHMTKKTLANPTSGEPNYTGHEFEPLLTGFNGCAVAGCHPSTLDASNKMVSLQFEISTGITNLVNLLNTWATVKGTNTFGAVNATKYKVNGWEYTTPGAYATITNAGPSSSDQLLIPVGVRQARFNLYMVGYGNQASLGVHNPTYTRFLLNDATNKVMQATQ